MIFGDPFAPGPEATEAPAQAGDAPPLPSAAPEPANAPNEPFRFRLLRPEEFALDDVYARLDRLGAYVPLLHGGWVQPGLPEDQAHPFDLSVLGGINPRGTIELYLSRFLHINVDLSYQPPQAGGQYGWQSADAVGLGEFALPPRYSLHAERRLRSGELHYIDHPAFGVLIQIRPQPTAKPQDAAQPAA